MNKSPQNQILKVPLLLKIFFQFSLFALALALGWTYLGDSTGESSKVIRPNELSDRELSAIVESLHLENPAQSLDRRSLELARIGHDFFFDPGFSSNDAISCASCHRPERSFTDGKAQSDGIAKTRMNSPTLVNVHLMHWFFWDGRAESLETQAMGPIEHPGEHGFSRVKVAHRIFNRYKKPYEKIFGPLPDKLPAIDTVVARQANGFISDEIAALALATLGNSDFQKSVLQSARRQGVQPIEIIKNYAALGSDQRPKSVSTSSPQISESELKVVNDIFLNFTSAIAAFERTIHSENSPFDLFAKSLKTTGDIQRSLHAQFGSNELRGLRVFAGKGQCLICHNGPTLSDQQFHNIGLPSRPGERDLNLGRSQGIIIARANPFSCKNNLENDKKQTESCAELGYLETENVDLVGAFKTPTLRQLSDTAPYGHDGRFVTLADVLNHYNELTAKPAVGRAEVTLKPLGLTQSELQDLESFLISLNGKVKFLSHSVKETLK